MILKRCPVCGLEKTREAFGRRSYDQSRLRSHCLDCERIKQAERRAANPEHYREIRQRSYEREKPTHAQKAAAWNRANPERFRANYLKCQRITAWQSWLVSTARIRSRKYGYGFDIDKAFLTELWERQGGRCYWLNIELRLTIENRGPERPSLDRLDPTRGYTRDNVVLSSQFANMGRSTLSAERFQQFINDNGLRR